MKTSSSSMYLWIPSPPIVIGPCPCSRRSGSWRLRPDDEIIDNSGVLPRFVRIFRLPTDNPHRTLRIQRTIEIAPDRDNPIFIKLTQEDGHIAWTSPIYFFR